MKYCRRCDLYAGYGALGVYSQPEQPPEWLATHCWCCGTHISQLQDEPQ